MYVEVMNLMWRRENSDADVEIWGQNLIWLTYTTSQSPEGLVGLNLVGACCLNFFDSFSMRF